MTVITAAQHISGLVTSSQSARGQNGYQTLASTTDLVSEKDVLAIEGRVRFSSALDGQSKWQYYHLPDTRAVLTRLISIPEPDDFGRSGRYFAHSLIFRKADWRVLDCAPFDLMRPHYFFSSINDVLRLESYQAGKIPSIQIETDLTWPNHALELLQSWSGEQLDALAVLIRNAPKCLEAGLHIALAGDELQVIDALKVAFYIAPPSIRDVCSFDTNATGCEWESGSGFWGRRYLGQANSSASFKIDAARHEVNISESACLTVSGFDRKKLSSFLRESVAHNPEPLRRDLNGRNSNRYEAVVSESIYQVLSRSPDAALTAEDRYRLKPLAEIHGCLRLLLALTSGDESLKFDVLRALKADEYAQCITDLRTSGFDSARLFCPAHAGTWFRRLDRSYSVDDLASAILLVSDHGSRQDRNDLKSIADYLQYEQLMELLERLRSSPRRFRRLEAVLKKSMKIAERKKRPRRSTSKWRKFREYIFRGTHS